MKARELADLAMDRKTCQDGVTEKRVTLDDDDRHAHTPVIGYTLGVGYSVQEAVGVPHRALSIPDKVKNLNRYNLIRTGSHNHIPAPIEVPVILLYHKFQK